jgi:L-malate glycosyltransferase
LRERGHEQIIVCLEGSALEAVVRKDGFQVFSLPTFDPWHAFGTLLWRQQLRGWGPAIVHAHDGRGQSLAWAASVGLPVQRVASRRVTFVPSDNWTYRLKYGHTCHAVIAVSESIRQLSIHAGVPAERITVIPDGIEIPEELPTAEERKHLRAAWEFGNEHFVVGLLGASSAEKGHDVAAAAFGILNQQMPQARLVAAGDAASISESAAANRGEHREPGLPRYVQIDKLDDFFPGIDLFIMPSKSEGLGSSALWAMAYGVPVIATRVGGLPEIVVENETGWLIPPNSPQALAGAIINAESDGQTLRTYGSQGRKRAEGFSAAIMVQRTEELYDRLTSGREI